MTYKVLNNITLKNVSDGVLSSVLTELLVIPVNKKILASPESVSYTHLTLPTSDLV